MTQEAVTYLKSFQDKLGNTVVDYINLHPSIDRDFPIDYAVIRKMLLILSNKELSPVFMHIKMRALIEELPSTWYGFIYDNHALRKALNKILQEYPRTELQLQTSQLDYQEKFNHAEEIQKLESKISVLKSQVEKIDAESKVKIAELNSKLYESEKIRQEQEHQIAKLRAEKLEMQAKLDKLNEKHELLMQQQADSTHEIKKLKINNHVLAETIQKNSWGVFKKTHAPIEPLTNSNQSPKENSSLFGFKLRIF